MKTISENVKDEYVINKSIFITELIKIDNILQVTTILDDIKNRHKDATHYCYAYIIDDLRKSSDDGEPGGTAGVPIMDTLNKANLNRVLCVVIRYFGGIKLGAGGLIRAYRKSVSDCLTKAKFKELIDGYSLVIETTYDKQKELDYILKNNYRKEFKENVIYYVDCDKETRNKLINNYKIIKEEEKIIEI